MATVSKTPNKAKAMIEAAYAGGYAIPALCVYNMEGIVALVRACEAANSPGMILLFPWAQTFSGLGLAAMASQCARHAKVPITVHLDHAQTEDAVKLAADSGLFDSIMVDMSHFEKEENLSKTHQWTQYCHERGILVEAEPGRIDGGEDGVAHIEDAILTDVEEAQRFADTEIDWLAPSFGNVHGRYGPQGPQLDYERLDSLKKVGPRLVLHGTDGFDETILAKCISAGITKVNINFVVNEQWKKSVKQDGVITKILENATTTMEKEVTWWIDALKSRNKAHQ